MTATFRLIVFDLDGTLVDSRQDIAESANAALVACGAQPLSEEALGRMVGDGAPKLIARAFAAAGIQRPHDALDRFLTIYDGRLLRHTRPYAGIPELLDQLARRAALAVLTNKPRAAAHRILEGLDLARYFPPDRVVGGDGPFPRKPDPAGLTHLMASAGVPPEAAVLIGDSVVDWRTAGAATTRVVLARYGFGWEGFPIEKLDADAWVVDSPAEMLEYL
jgi:phosphoglycolate phosphatase